MFSIFLLTRYFLLTIVIFYNYHSGRLFINPVLWQGLLQFTTALLAIYIDTFQEIKLVINISFNIFSGVQVDLFLS